MIDTDKYEGHTPSPWTVRGSGFQTESVIATTNLSALINTDTKMKVAAVNLGGYERRREHDMNVKLIADAPLLLAEVRRLREKLRRIGDLSYKEVESAEEGNEVLLEIDEVISE